VLEIGSLKEDLLQKLSATQLARKLRGWSGEAVFTTTHH
jgi:hypothetical protein